MANGLCGYVITAIFGTATIIEKNTFDTERRHFCMIAMVVVASSCIIAAHVRFLLLSHHLDQSECQV